MSPFLSSPDMPAGRAPAGAGPIGFAEDRPGEDRSGAVTENSALGHVLRRLAWEAAHPDVPHPAEFESSLECEAPMV